MSGSISVITGPMFAGKTKRMLKLVRNASQYKSCALFKHATDDGGNTFIVGHDGQREPAIKTACLMNYSTDMENIDVIGIDEGQWVSTYIYKFLRREILLTNFYTIFFSSSMIWLNFQD